MATRLSSGIRESILDAIKTAFNDSVIHFYTGTQPASADAAEIGDKLVEITLDGLAFVGGAPGNGLSFDVITHTDSNTISVLAKNTAETWKGTALRDGTIGYGRLYGNDLDLGASVTAIRIDGEALTITGASFKVSTQTTKTGVEVVVTEMNITIPY